MNGTGNTGEVLLYGAVGDDVRPAAAATITNVLFEWYEHTNRV